MTKYRVMLNGQNFLVELDGKKQTLGFCVLRFVEADNPELAEKAAIHRLCEQREFSDLVLNDKQDPFVIVAETISEIASFDGVKNIDPGLAWYPEESDSSKGQ